MSNPRSRGRKGVVVQLGQIWIVRVIFRLHPFRSPNFPRNTDRDARWSVFVLNLNACPRIYLFLLLLSCDTLSVLVAIV